MSMGSEVFVLTWTMAEVGNTRMCVQDVSWGVLSCDVCMLSVVLRPNTEPVDTESAEARREDLEFLHVKFLRFPLFNFQPYGTWHDNKGTLWLHGDQTGAEDAGRVGGGDATHPTRLLQTLTEGLQVPPAQQNAPVCNE